MPSEHRTDPLELLWSRAAVAAPRHPVEQAYGSALELPIARPYLVANFVQTVDGVVAFGGRGGNAASTVSLDSAIDRHVMALLRSQVDAIVIGAGTFREAHHHQWTPGGLVPGLATAFDELREETRGDDTPAPLYIVTVSGELDPSHAALREPQTAVSVLTTDAGATALEGRLAADVEVLSLGAGKELDPVVLLDLVGQRSGGLVLCEGGPRLLGDLYRADVVDELFLTVAPQIAGRDDAHPRAGLSEGFAAAPAEAPRVRLDSLRRGGDHLFLRYRRGAER